MTTLANTWTDRDLPILQSALRRMDQGAQSVDLKLVSSDTGLEMTQVIIGTKALEAASPPYLAAEYIVTAQLGAMRGWINTINERARRELGTWPSPESVLERLIVQISEAADAEDEPQRKTKLRATAEALRSFARDVAVQAIGSQLGGLGPVGAT